MVEESEALRSQIDRLEGSLHNARNRNSNYADMTLVLADASQQMDYDRFIGSCTEPENAPLKYPSLQVSPTRTDFDLEYDEIEETDDVTCPYMGRFDLKMEPVQERESQRDLREFINLEAPEDVTDDYTPHYGYSKEQNFDLSEDYDYTPQQQGVDSCPLEMEYTRNCLNEYNEYDTEFRGRARSKTQAELPNRDQNKSIRSNSQLLEPVASRGFDESLAFDDPMRYYPNQPAGHKRIDIQHRRIDLISELSPIEDTNGVYEVSNEVEDDYNVDNAISTLEDRNVMYAASNRRSRLDSKRSSNSGEGNRSDSDSEFDNFISKYQEPFVQPPPQEEMRTKSPHYQRPVSKSSLGSYHNAIRSISPKNIFMRKKEGQPEQQKRSTLPSQAMANYEEYGPRTPGPYKSNTTSFDTPQPNLAFRPVQSAKDQYSTVFSRRRRSTTEYTPDEEPQHEVPNTPVENNIFRRSSQRSFNRNKTTDHRNYTAYSRQEIVSPTSPLQEGPYSNQARYEIIVNSSEVTNTHQPPEYSSRNEYANRNTAYSEINYQRRQPPQQRNVYADPNQVSVPRNHGYNPNNDNTSPVQSLDSGIYSSFNDNRPRTVAGETTYSKNDIDGYDESARESLKEMEKIAFQLRTELKVFTDKVNLFETEGIRVPNKTSQIPPSQLPCSASPPPLHRIMSPTGQKYSSYAANQMRCSSVASSNSEGSRIKQDQRPRQITRPVTCVSPVESYQSNPVSNYSRPHYEYTAEYKPPVRESMHAQKPPKSNLKNPIFPQTSSPNIRPKSVTKMTSNTVNSTSKLTRPSNLNQIPRYPPVDKTYAPSMPRAQSSTGTSYMSASSTRLQTPRYTAAPSANRSISPQPKTYPRRQNPAPRPLNSSNSYRISDRYSYDEDIPKQHSLIPKANQRHY